MEIAELQQITLQVLRDMYTRCGQNLYDSQFMRDLNTGTISNRVALQAYRAQLWRSPQPLTREDETHVGDAFPREDVGGVRSILWRFVGLGILTPRMITDERNQFFELSRYGAEVLLGTEESPYDPLGFLRALRTHSPYLEPNSIEYIEEAVNCFLSRLLRAAAVMVGLASENEILKLVDIYGSNLDAEEKRAFDRKIRSCQNLKEKFVFLYDVLCQRRRDLPPEIRELDTWLNGVFQVIRLSRNDAGHPISICPPSEDVFANLVLFRTYARYLSKLKEYLSSPGQQTT